jgi:hypothetical protein
MTIKSSLRCFTAFAVCFCIGALFSLKLPKHEKASVAYPVYFSLRVVSGVPSIEVLSASLVTGEPIPLLRVTMINRGSQPIKSYSLEGRNERVESGVRKGLTETNHPDPFFIMPSQVFVMDIPVMSISDYKEIVVARVVFKDGSSEVPRSRVE